jgi:hypothetical protein
LLEHIVVLFLFLFHMMLDLFLEHGDLGIEKFVVGTGGDDLVDQYLGAVMLDIGFLQEVVVDLALERGVENLFLDLRMNLELGADLVGDAALFLGAAGLFEASTSRWSLVRMWVASVSSRFIAISVHCLPRSEGETGGCGEGCASRRLITPLRARRAVEAVAGDRTVDDVTTQTQAHFFCAGGRGADEAGAARLQRLDRADADALRQADLLHLGFGEREIHRAAHSKPGSRAQARIAVATCS